LWTELWDAEVSRLCAIRCTNQKGTRNVQTFPRWQDHI